MDGGVSVIDLRHTQTLRSFCPRVCASAGPAQARVLEQEGKRQGRWSGTRSDAVLSRKGETCPLRGVTVRVCLPTYLPV